MAVLIGAIIAAPVYWALRLGRRRQSYDSLTQLVALSLILIPIGLLLAATWLAWLAAPALGGYLAIWGVREGSIAAVVIGGAMILWGGLAWLWTVTAVRGERSRPIGSIPSPPVPADLLSEIEFRATSSLPFEISGVVRRDGEGAYELTQQETRRLRELMRQMDARPALDDEDDDRSGSDVFGFYLSQPQGDGIPTLEDCVAAFKRPGLLGFLREELIGDRDSLYRDPTHPGVYYFVVSFRGRKPSVRTFQFGNRGKVFECS